MRPTTQFPVVQQVAPSRDLFGGLQVLPTVIPRNQKVELPLSLPSPRPRAPPAAQEPPLPLRAGPRSAPISRAHPRATRCRLVVVSLEVGGRWSSEVATFVRLLAQAKARSHPPPSRPFVAAAWGRRWCGLLAFAAQRAFLASLLALPGPGRTSTARLRSSATLSSPTATARSPAAWGHVREAAP